MHAVTKRERDLAARRPYRRLPTRQKAAIIEAFAPPPRQLELDLGRCRDEATLSRARW